MWYSILTIWLLSTNALAYPPPQHPPHPRPARPYPHSHWKPGPTHGTDVLAAKGFKNLNTYLGTHRKASSSCDLHTAYRRKEWDSLRPREKQEYIRAVQCLQTKPSIIGAGVAPGARTRYDDFVAVHVNQTLHIHSTGNFLTWHRYFVWIYEKALREECDYEGYQPYINWGRLSNSVIGAPIFDGSDLSIGSNGAYSPHDTIYLPSKNASVVELPPQEGGGCITSGPFVNMSINLGPVGLVGVNDTAPNPLASGLGYNPRCLKRDLSLLSASGASDANSTHLITASTTIKAFQDEMQGPFIYGIPQYGVHTAGHFIVSGDPGGDFFTSPGDPWFWFHHAQIDRTFWIWQNQDLPARYGEIDGTLTFLNQPPSRNATLDDVFDVGINDGYRGISIREAMSTTEGKFCYVYE